MIKVSRIMDEHQERNGKKLFLIEYKSTDDAAFWGGFTEYISQNNLPKINQCFENAQHLEQYCRGEWNKKSAYDFDSDQDWQDRNYMSNDVRFID